MRCFSTMCLATLIKTKFNKVSIEAVVLMWPLKRRKATHSCCVVPEFEL